MFLFRKKPNLDDLKDRLKNETVNFTYRKVNGQRRKARGTLQGCEIEQNRFGCLVYFDIDCNDIRCFRIENLLKVE